MFWLVFILLIAVFIGLAVLLRFLMKQHFTSAAAHLQELSTDYGRRQEELKQRLQDAERQYEEQLGRARTEADRLVSEAKQEAESLRARRLDEARQESERIVQQGLDSRDALRKEVERQMEQRALQRAFELLQEALPESFRRDIQRHWVEELFRDGLSQLSRVDGEAAQDVKVVSAFPLEAAQRSALIARLKAVCPKELPLTETVDPNLVAGLIITVGSLVLDGSLSSRVQHAVRRHAAQSQ